MSLRPLATALIMVLIAAPAHAELIIDSQDGRSPTVVSDASIARGLSSTAAPTNLHFDAPAAPAMTYRSVDPAKVVVPQAHTMQAQYVVPGRVAAPAASGVFETGSSRPADANAPVQGWADNVPLELALQQVIPQGWRVSATPSVKSLLGSSVSWSGNRPWVSVLGAMVSSMPLAARVDWDTQQVLLFDRAAPMPSSLVVPGAVVIRGAPQPVATPVVAVRQAQHQVVAPVQAVPVQVAAPVPCCAPVAAPVVVQSAPVSQRWLIDPRMTLRENVEAWTKQAGWNSVVWEAADYEMVAPAQFEGSFTSPEGPLAKLIQAYAESDQPLKVRLLTQDKVVHVSNRNYTPTVVDPATPSSITPSTFSQ